jgi:hypothetical protein
MCMPIINQFCCVLHNLTVVCVHIGGALLHSVLISPVKVTDILENCFAKVGTLEIGSKRLINM